MSQTEFKTKPLEVLLEHVDGWLPLNDAQYLSQNAAQALGNVVEIGSYRGRSTIALAHGIANSISSERLVYAIEPHTFSVGIHGGKFGPNDRVAFYQNVLNAQLVAQIALVNFESEMAAKAWEGEIGLLFIDGDHNYDAVKRDAKCWTPNLMVDGLVIFDDARQEDDGPSRVIRELLDSGQFVKSGGTDKLQALKKI